MKTLLYYPRGKTFNTYAVPDAVENIGYRAFAFCPTIEIVILPNELKSIGQPAFGETGLTSIQLPDTVTHIGFGAFSGDKNLTGINIPEGVTKIEAGVFDSSGLESITMPDTITSIGGCAFFRTAVTDVVVPEGVTEIGDYAFSVGSVKNITLPHSLKEIGNCVFDNCGSLESINYMGTREEFNKIGGYANIPIDKVTFHEHNFTEWKHDAKCHRLVCECGAENTAEKHTPKAAAKENGVAATYTAAGSYDTVVYCNVCNGEISRTANTIPKLTLDVMSATYTKDAFYKADVTASITINNVPQGAKVCIDGKEATASGNTYTAKLGQFAETKTVKVEIKLGNEVLESSELTVKVDNGFCAKIGSWFSNLLFNGFKRRELLLNF